MKLRWKLIILAVIHFVFITSIIICRDLALYEARAQAGKTAKLLGDEWSVSNESRSWLRDDKAFGGEPYVAVAFDHIDDNDPHCAIWVTMFSRRTKLIPEAFRELVESKLD